MPGHSAPGQRDVVERVDIIRVLLVIANSLSEVFLQPSVQFVSRSAALYPSRAAILAFFVEKRRPELRVQRPRERSSTLPDLGGGDVLCLILAKLESVAVDMYQLYKLL